MLALGIIPALRLLQQDSGDTRFGTGWWIFMGCFAAYLIVVALWGSEGAQAPGGPIAPLSDNYGNASSAPQQTAMPAGVSDFGGVFLGKSSAPEWDNQPLESNPGIPVSSTLSFPNLGFREVDELRPCARHVAVIAQSAAVLRGFGGSGISMNA